ncbi:polyphosphate kinase 2 [Methylobrevis albus]|uniref:ADP/GDP-polyphosphate phosphotransferase n=1 Tax=Methylobrevis albus TaxID=2793297 RepID=A0A931I1G1_9HYPH|nr:polyphosphate kinase 2 [Methylobrevis albus]MBH0238547.1 polyphosphate kinase 2 [Methylobrevis albus]
MAKKKPAKREKAEAAALKEVQATLLEAPGLGDAPAIDVDGIRFDLDEPVFPAALEARCFTSDGFPYEKRLPSDDYEATLHALQVELVKLQRHMTGTGARLVALYEGRDAAGKGGAIETTRAYLNPRNARIVALPKPTDAERGQWYFQRYAVQLPSAGEFVLFDRSWYNRAGVERVMGFCTEAQAEAFLKAATEFEDMLVDDGIVLVKFFLEIGREMQLKRFHERRHDPLKIWKLSPIDFKAMSRFDDYTAARDRMLETTHSAKMPWTVIRANDKRRARLEAIRHVLGRFDYPGKDPAAIGVPDKKIIGSGPDFLKGGTAR